MLKVKDKDLKTIVRYCLDGIIGNFENIVNFEVDRKYINL